MNRALGSGHAKLWRKCMLAGIALAAAGQAVAADRGGGMRQVPLIPPSSMKSSSGSISAPPATENPGQSAPGADIIQSPGSVVIASRGERYVVSAGRWYELRGEKLRAISPPQGLLVPELPRGYSMRWVGGVPYFYSDGLYYLWRERKRSYEVLPTPPTGNTGQRDDNQAPPRPDAAQEPVEAP